ncbi:efflux pump antibiotic resistance protein [Penicillium hispanicum]|uniref:efflux pump antibiotic resistance protein n=1 Tax=Penicillium hispanicum TaxID=1080232 RepID=UPI0025412D18|nr:efflux pump antibiotic resistance protein [Penicillium hispanicum]KAJ5569821.1 efflux pump antibiotic resistance protein [Penicillium hispanicum]
MRGLCLMVFGARNVALFGLNEWVARFPLIPFSGSQQNVTLLVLSFLPWRHSHWWVFLPPGLLSKCHPIGSVLLLPWWAHWLCPSGLAGWHTRATRRCREVIILGMFFTTLGHGPRIDLKPYTSWSKFVLYQMIVGIGLGSNFQATLITLQANVKPLEISQATAAFV